MGADIVVTGRTADSALALAPCVHEFKWNLEKDWDLLASGSLAGHLIECGGQATGGLFTDWQKVANGYANLGFPIVEMSANGDIDLSKPPKTGGIVDQAAVAEQMLYEIGDPANYLLPDVNCDFTKVTMTQTDADHVKVQGAIGKPPTDTFKVSATYMDGFKATCVSIINGGHAGAKAHAVANAILNRSRAINKHMGMDDFSDTYVTAIGDEESFGKNASKAKPREVAMWMSVKHKEKKALDIWAREIASAGTGMAPGLSALVGGRPKPSPCLKLYSFLYPKSHLPATIQLDDQQINYLCQNTSCADTQTETGNEVEPDMEVPTGPMTYTLEDLAYARSGDKGDSCNIGVIARDPKYLPYIKKYVTSEAVHSYFEHFIDSSEGKVTRFDLPGIHAVNFLLEKSLGGGGIASMRPDPLGKSFAQMLLSMELKNMPELKDL